MKLIKFIISVLIIVLPIAMWVVTAVTHTNPSWYVALSLFLLLFTVITPFVVMVLIHFSNWWDNQLKHTGKL